MPKLATDLQAANRATGIPASDYLAVEFRLPQDGDVPDQRLRMRLAAAQRDLVGALEREPGVRRVAVGDVLPRMEHRSRPYELDPSLRSGQAAPGMLRWTRLARVDVDFFDALGTSILKGRDFERTDAEEGLTLHLVKIEDFFHEVPDSVVKVAFAAETQNVVENAKRKPRTHGHLDLISACQGVGQVSVLMNLGNGTFAPAVNYVTAEGADWVVAADLDNDVYGDLVAYASAGAAWTGSDGQLQAKAPGLAHLILGSPEYQFV